MKESDNDYQRVNTLQTFLCVLKNPSMHLDAEGEWDLTEEQRIESIREIEKEQTGVLHFGGCGFDLFKNVQQERHERT